MQNTNVFTIRIPKFSIFDYCALYVVLWSITPLLSRGSIFRYIAVAASVIVLLNIVPRKKTSVKTYEAFALLLLFFLFFNLVVSSGDFSFAFTRCINTFVFCMLSLISIYYYNNDKRTFMMISKAVLVMYSIIAIPSIIAVRINPYVLRNASGERARAGIERFAGSYGYVFGCIFLIVLLLYDARHTHSKKKRIIELFLVGLFMCVLMYAGFTTALVLVLIGVYLSLFAPKKRLVISSIVMVIAGVIIIQMIPLLLEWLVKEVELPNVYKDKFEYLYQLSIGYGNVTYGDSTRGGMFYDSLKALSQYPVFGSILLSGHDASSGHAVLLDTLVNHGVFFFIIYWYVIILPPWKLMNKDNTIRLVYLIMIVLLGLTDTIDYATMVVPLFIGPLITDNNYEGENERS